MSDQLVLDLFAGLGGFSAAFEDSDQWDVVTVDIEPEFEPDIQTDVMDLRPSNLPNPDLVLASPPCTEFSPAQNLNGDHSPDPDAIALVFHSIGLIKALSPDYWFLENPRGCLRSHLGQPTATITYCQYGTDYQKPTDLWGEHPPGLSYRSCNQGDVCHVNGRDGTNPYPGDVAEKSRVPQELSKAILEAVNAALEGETSEQATFEEVVA